VGSREYGVGRGRSPGATLAGEFRDEVLAAPGIEQSAGRAKRNWRRGRDLEEGRRPSPRAKKTSPAQPRLF